MNKETCTAILLAGGTGKRMKSSVRKQYMLLDGKPLLMYSLKALEQYQGITEIILVVGSGEVEYCRRELVEKYRCKKVRDIVEGGKERYHSVYEGIKAASSCDYLLIHDGARPFLTAEILERVMQCVRVEQACVAGMLVKDTIKIADKKGFAEQTPDRNTVWAVQTPQVFTYSLIKEAYEMLMERKDIANITDDAMVVETMKSINVKLVEGSYRNIKVTTPEDYEIAKAFMQTIPPQEETERT